MSKRTTKSWVWKSVFCILLNGIILNSTGLKSAEASNNYILKWPSEVINTFKNAWGCCLSPNVVSLIPERRRREGINQTKCGDKQHPNAFLKVLHYRQQGHFNIVNFFLLSVFDNEQLLLFHYEMNTFYSHRHFVKSCWFEYLAVVLLSLIK